MSESGVRLRNELGAALMLLILVQLPMVLWMAWHGGERVDAVAATFRLDEERGLPVEAIVYGVVVAANPPGKGQMGPPLHSNQAIFILPALGAFRAWMRGDHSSAAVLEPLFRKTFTDDHIVAYRRAWSLPRRAPDDPEALMDRFEAVVRASVIEGEAGSDPPLPGKL